MSENAIIRRGKRRLAGNILLTVSFIASLGATMTAAWGQAYPNRPIRLIYSFSAGSAVHSSMLLLAQEASKLLGQPLVVDVKPGAGGRIGFEEALRAAPDGYVITQASYALLVLQGAVDPKLKVEPGKDYAPIIASADLPYVMVAHPSMPFRDVKGFIAQAKANPGKLNVAGGPVNSDAYFGLLRMKSMYGIDFLLVPFKGSVDGVPAQLNGLVDVSIINGIVKPHVDAGKMIGIATTAGRRWDLFANLPTLVESGVDLTIGTVSGVVAPAGTPDVAVARLNQVFAKVMSDPEIRSKFSELGLLARSSTPEEYARMIRSEIETWGPIVQKAGIKPGLN